MIHHSWLKSSVANQPNLSVWQSLQNADWRGGWGGAKKIFFCRVRLAGGGPKRLRFSAESRKKWKTPNGLTAAPEKIALLSFIGKAHTTQEAWARGGNFAKSAPKQFNKAQSRSWLSKCSPQADPLQKHTRPSRPGQGAASLPTLPPNWQGVCTLPNFHSSVLPKFRV